MIVGWIFGVTFGLLLGIGGTNVVAYQSCLKEGIKTKQECAVKYHVPVDKQ